MESSAQRDKVGRRTWDHIYYWLPIVIAFAFSVGGFVVNSAVTVAQINGHITESDTRTQGQITESELRLQGEIKLLEYRIEQLEKAQAR